MKLKCIVLLGLLFPMNVTAQSLGDFKPKDQAYGLKKVAKIKKIYIAGFRVNYQLYNEKEDFKQGGRMLGGGYKGDAKAQLSVGLEGITGKALQDVTDKLYGDYLAMIREKGLTVLSADDAAQTDTYSEYTRLKGGEISLAQYPGTLTAVPSGYEYYVKKVTKSGKTKSGGFLNNPATMYARLSRDLDDAIIAEVNLFVLFVEDKQALNWSGANIKIKTNLRLADQEAIVMTSDAKIKFKGQNDVDHVSSLVGFYQGKIGLGTTTSYSGTLGKALEINNVIQDEKLQSFARNDRDAIGTPFAYGVYFNPDNTTSTTTKIIPVQEQKYCDGVYMAAKKFMEYHTTNFLNNL